MTVPHYGKREPGLLTAVSPGDTLYFAFGSYNDSGDSEQISPTSSLAVTDLEVIKNGLPTVRATDSGYSLISDTGQVGDRAGLYRCSVQLYNTADDAAFYASGSWYQVFIDAITIDGKTVRFWLGSFEIGRQRVNAIEINSDTGAASVLSQFAGTNGTLSPTGELDTGSVANNSYLPGNMIRIDSDTGAADVLQKFANTNGTLSPSGELDTGSVANNSYLRANAALLAGDTGAADRLRAAYIGGFTDTGINDRLAKILADTDTGIQSSVNVTTFADTGVNERLETIEGKTNSLTFTVAGQADANIQSVNDVAVGGTGSGANRWGPA